LGGEEEREREREESRVEGIAKEADVGAGERDQVETEPEEDEGDVTTTFAEKRQIAWTLLKDPARDGSRGSLVHARYGS
jgi:hypothetical protein